MRIKSCNMFRETAPVLPFWKISTNPKAVTSLINSITFIWLMGWVRPRSTVRCPGCFAQIHPSRPVPANSFESGISRTERREMWLREGGLFTSWFCSFSRSISDLTCILRPVVWRLSLYTRREGWIVRFMILPFSRPRP